MKCGVLRKIPRISPEILRQFISTRILQSKYHQPMNWNPEVEQCKIFSKSNNQPSWTPTEEPPYRHRCCQSLDRLQQQQSCWKSAEFDNFEKVDYSIMSLCSISVSSQKCKAALRDDGGVLKTVWMVRLSQRQLAGCQIGRQHWTVPYRCYDTLLHTSSHAAIPSTEISSRNLARPDWFRSSLRIHTVHRIPGGVCSSLWLRPR